MLASALSISWAALALLACGAQGIEVNVEDFGAKADGKTECGAAFNAALRNVSMRGGGTVFARGKGVYIVAPIHMQNDTTLYIASGAYVNATHNCPSDVISNLTMPRPARCGGEASTTWVCGGVFFAANAHNFTIRGGGTVDGGGLAFDYPPYTHPRGPVLSFWMSSDAVVEDLSIYNAASTHLSPVYSQRMHFRRLYMYSDFIGPNHKNTDGFDPVASSDISFTDSYVHNGDDCIAVKSGKEPSAWTCGIPCKNILVKNVTCAGSHGLTIGSEIAGGIENVTFSDVQIHGSDGQPSAGGVKIKHPCGRGAYVKDIVYKNIYAYNVASAVSMSAYGPGGSCSINGTTILSNIIIRNMYALKIAGPAFDLTGFSVEGQPANYTALSLELENVTVVDYKQIGSCSHALVKASAVSPAVPNQDHSCMISDMSRTPRSAMFV